MSWGANTVTQFEQTDRKGSNFLVTLGNPEYAAFVQNMFKLVRWASGVVRRQRFVKRICPCDTDEMSVEGRWDYRKLLVASILKLLVRPILAVLPLRGRIRADFGLVRVSGKNPNQRPSRSPDTNPEYPRAALGCLERKKPDAKFILYF
jgi:hypothetical protein